MSNLETRREFIKKAVSGAIGAGSLGLEMLGSLPVKAERKFEETVFEQIIEYRYGEPVRYNKRICSPVLEQIDDFAVSGDGEKIFVTERRSPNFENTIAVYNAENASREASFVGGEGLSISTRGSIVAYETTNELSGRFGGVVEVVDISHPALKPFRLESQNNDSAYTSPRISGNGARLAVKKGTWHGQEHKDQMYLYNLTDLNAEPKEISQALENRIGRFAIIPYPEISSDGRFVVFIAQAGFSDDYLCIWNDDEERLMVVRDIIGGGVLDVSSSGVVVWGFEEPGEAGKIGFLEWESAKLGAKPILIDLKGMDIDIASFPHIKIADDGMTIMVRADRRERSPFELPGLPYMVDVFNQEFHQISLQDKEWVIPSRINRTADLSSDGRRVFVKCSVGKGKEQIQFFEQAEP